MNKIIYDLQEILKEAVEQKSKEFFLEYSESEDIQKFSELNGSGKRIRGMLLLLTYYVRRQNLEAVKRDALPLAITIEFLETSLLIQDDVIDMGLQRRGCPTIHSILQTERHIEKQSAGVAAHLMGVLGITYAIRLLQDYDEQVREIFYEMLRDTIQGEVLDMFAPVADNRDHMVSHERVELFTTITEWKTSVYSFEVPMYLGYSLSGGSERNWFQKIGRELGHAFQMKNDLEAMENIYKGYEMTDISPYRMTASNIIMFEKDKRLEDLVLQPSKSDAVKGKIRDIYRHNYGTAKRELNHKISMCREHAVGLFNDESCPFRKGEFELLEEFIKSLF